MANFDKAIDRTSAVPYYYQLQEILKQEIENGRWQPGDTLPSEAELAEGLQISRTVIRQALDVLEGDGQVYRIKGKGTVLARPKFRYEAIAATQAWGAEAIAETTLSRIVDVRLVPAGARLGRLLGVAAASPLCEVVCIESIAHTAVQLSQIYFSSEGNESLKKLVASGALPTFDVGGPEAFAQLGHKYGLTVRRSQITVEVTIANDFEGELLGVKAKAPMFLLSSLSLDDSDRAIVFSRNVVRSDYFRFALVVDYATPSAPTLDMALSLSRLQKETASSSLSSHTQIVNNEPRRTKRLRHPR